MSRIENPRNIVVDFDRYQKKYAKASYLEIHGNKICIKESGVVHIYNWDRVNSVEYEA